MAKVTSGNLFGCIPTMDPSRIKVAVNWHYEKLGILMTVFFLRIN